MNFQDTTNLEHKLDENSCDTEKISDAVVGLTQTIIADVQKQQQLIFDHIDSTFDNDRKVNEENRISLTEVEQEIIFEKALKNFFD